MEQIRENLDTRQRDGCFFIDDVAYLNMKRTVFQETPDQANRRARYPKGFELCTDNPVVGIIKLLTEVKEAQVDIISAIHELVSHVKYTTEIVQARAPSHKTTMGVLL